MNMVGVRGDPVRIICKFCINTAGLPPLGKTREKSLLHIRILWACEFVFEGWLKKGKLTKMKGNSIVYLWRRRRFTVMKTIDAALPKDISERNNEFGKDKRLILCDRRLQRDWHEPGFINILITSGSSPSESTPVMGRRCSFQCT